MREFTAIAVYSDIKRTDILSVQTKRLTSFFKMRYGGKSNFLDVPTDCPQRDERLGWTGDAQVFVKTASYNFNVNKFFEKWLADLAADQKENSAVTDVVPDILEKDRENGAAAWGDASVICPWQLYLTYGNKEILKRQFESMKKWVDYSVKTERFGYGDWLALDHPDGDDRGLTSQAFIDRAFNIYSTELLVKSAKLSARTCRNTKNVLRISEILLKMSIK